MLFLPELGDYRHLNMHTGFENRITNEAGDITGTGGNKHVV